MLGIFVTEYLVTPPRQPLNNGNETTPNLHADDADDAASQIGGQDAEQTFVRTIYDSIGHIFGNLRQKTNEKLLSILDNRNKADFRELVDAGYGKLQNERIQPAKEINNKQAVIGIPNMTGTDPHSKSPIDPVIPQPLTD
jgi:hypothetical protein